MLTRFIVILFVMECSAIFHFNVTRTTLSGLAAYRSSLTLDWLAAEDERQGAMVEEAPLTRCHEYAAPSPRKVGRYLLEMLRKLDSDNAVVKDFIRTLVNFKILVEVSSYESEPDLESLVKTPEVLRTEPHTTFPRVMALVWIAVTDPEHVEKNGWCSIDKVSQFLMTVEPSDVVEHLRTMYIVMGKARLVVDNFVQHFVALNIMHQSRKSLLRKRSKPTHTTREVLLSPSLVRSEVENFDRNENRDEACLSIRPSNTDIVKQFLNVLPYLDRGNSNAAFLANYRATFDHLSDAANPLDREAALYAAVLTPLILLQNTKNSWCLLERFHRALRLYQNSRPSEKRRALDQLLNFQTARHRVHEVIKALPAPMTRRTTLSVKKFLTDDKELGYIEEIIKNFG